MFLKYWQKTILILFFVEASLKAPNERASSPSPDSAAEATSSPGTHDFASGSDAPFEVGEWWGEREEAGNGITQPGRREHQHHRALREAPTQSPRAPQARTARHQKMISEQMDEPGERSALEKAQEAAWAELISQSNASSEKAQETSGRKALEKREAEEFTDMMEPHKQLLETKAFAEDIKRVRRRVRAQEERERIQLKDAQETSAKETISQEKIEQEPAADQKPLGVAEKAAQERKAKHARIKQRQKDAETAATTRQRTDQDTSEEESLHTLGFLPRETAAQAQAHRRKKKATEETTPEPAEQPKEPILYSKQITLTLTERKTIINLAEGLETFYQAQCKNDEEWLRLRRMNVEIERNNDYIEKENYPTQYTLIRPQRRTYKKVTPNRSDYCAYEATLKMPVDWIEVEGWIWGQKKFGNPYYYRQYPEEILNKYFQNKYPKMIKDKKTERKMIIVKVFCSN